jgi:hypothetical protein
MNFLEIERALEAVMSAIFSALLQKFIHETGRPKKKKQKLLLIYNLFIFF